MQTISLTNVLPNVFAPKANEIRSEIWKQQVTFKKGEVILIEADSGTGKSSLCSYILGYRHDYSGTISFDDKNARDIPVGGWVDIRKKSISHLFQELRLFPELTALENVNIKNSLTNFKGEEQIKEWFDRLGLADKLDSEIGKMSFGQQQRVALIRALVQPFDFVLLDEPISHLDENNSRIMGDILLEEARSQGAGVIVTSIGKRMELDYDRVYKL